MKHDLGKRFGMLVITSDPFIRTNPSGRQIPFVSVRCDCGTEKAVNCHNLRNGHTRSCGCLALAGRRRHGDAVRGSETRLYKIYKSLKSRCTKESNNYYGGKGVKNEFGGYEQFKQWALENGYRDTLEIDRIDVNGNYCPDNCRWVTHAKNCSENKTGLRLVELFGELKCASQWCKDPRIPVRYSTFKNRFYRMGWDIIPALTTPPIPTGQTRLSTYNLGEGEDG